jgi:hypothetical protein
VSFIALIIGLGGASLVGQALLGGQRLPLEWAVGAVLATAVLELIVASRLGAAAMPHLAAGIMALGFAVFLFGLSLISDQAFAAGPVTLMLGLFCMSNGLLGALDVGFLHPSAWPLELVNALVTLVLGGVALSTWPLARVETVSVIAGVELLASAVAIAGGAGSFTGPRQPSRRRRPMHLAPRGLERPA